MKKTSKILSVFLALVMVISCIPMSAFAQGRDTSSLDAYIDTDNLAVVVEDLLTSLGNRKEEIVPSVLNICFQLIDDLKEQAEADGVDVMNAETEELASSLLAYLDDVLADADLNSEIGAFSSVIGMVLGGVDIDLNSVNGVLGTLVAALDYLAERGTSFCGDAAEFNTSDLKVGKGKKAEAMSTKNASSLQIVYGLFGFISNEDNIAIIKKVVGGKLDLGSVNGIVELAGINLEEEVNGLMGNLDATINELLYDNLLAEKETVTNEDGTTSEVIKVAYADSIYKDYTCDELLAAALLKVLTGEDASKADSAKLAGMTLYEMIGAYADAAIAKFALDFINNDLKGYINDLIAMDPQLEVLNSIINKDYVVTSDTFNFAELAQDGLFENMNNMICKLVEVIAQPAVVKELNLKAGGNENMTHNLTAFFGYLLKTLASNNGGKLEFTADGVAYSFDFSGFTADKIAGKTLEDMLVSVVGLFYPTLLDVNLPADVDTLEKLVGYTAYVCIDKFMVQDADIAFDNDYKSLVFAADGKVKDMSQAQWNDVLGEMGMDVAVYWLDGATNFGMSQADLKALKAEGWTWEDVFEDIVDWALNYIDGIPAVADHLTTERGKNDGSAWYKLNVVINEFMPLAFVNGCEDETFTFDLYTAIMEVIVPSLYNADFAAFANILATNDKADNPFNQPLIASVLGIVDNLLFSIFEHECGGELGEFKKVATATHDGYEGTYCVANGHYVDVKVLPATGATETKPTETTTNTDPSETTTQEPPVADVMKGDVNGDGKVTAADARKALRAASRLETLDDTAFKAADVNGDSKVNAADARTILRVASRLETFA